MEKKLEKIKLDGEKVQLGLETTTKQGYLKGINLNINLLVRFLLTLGNLLPAHI